MLDNSRGSVFIPRTIDEMAFYKDSEYFLLYFHLVQKANFEDKNIIFNGRSMTIKRGSFVTSRAKLSEQTGIEPSKVERTLKFFQNENLIKIENCRRFRVITILNYDKMQKPEQIFEQKNEQVSYSRKSEKVNRTLSREMNRSRTDREQIVNTTNKDKNDKNDKKGNRTPVRAKTSSLKIPVQVEKLIDKCLKYYAIIDPAAARCSPGTVKKNINSLVEILNEKDETILDTVYGYAQYRKHQGLNEGKEPDFTIHAANFFDPSKWEDTKFRFLGFKYIPQL